MFYKKPSGVTYTQMAIWVDDNAYAENVNLEKMYEYIWHLCNVLAFKWKYFNKAQDYDEFAIFSANKIFERY